MKFVFPAHIVDLSKKADGYSSPSNLLRPSQTFGVQIPGRAQANLLAIMFLDASEATKNIDQNLNHGEAM